MNSFTSDLSLLDFKLTIDYEITDAGRPGTFDYPADPPELEVISVTDEHGNEFNWIPKYWKAIHRACWYDAKELQEVYKEQSFGL